MSKKFPFKIDLEQRPAPGEWPVTGYWYPDESRHKEIVKWLNEYVGDRRVDWYCHEAGYYFLKREEDAVALKLRWV